MAQNLPQCLANRRSSSSQHNGQCNLNLKRTLQSRRTQGPEPTSSVVGFTDQEQAWGGEGMWRNPSSPQQERSPVSQSPYTCWRKGGRVIQARQEWSWGRGSRPSSPTSPLGAQLAGGRGRCLAGLPCLARGGGAGLPGTAPPVTALRGCSAAASGPQAAA